MSFLLASTSSKSLGSLLSVSLSLSLSAVTFYSPPPTLHHDITASRGRENRGVGGCRWAGCCDVERRKRESVGTTKRRVSSAVKLPRTALVKKANERMGLEGRTREKIGGRQADNIVPPVSSPAATAVSYLSTLSATYYAVSHEEGREGLNCARPLLDRAWFQYGPLPRD